MENTNNPPQQPNQAPQPVVPPAQNPAPPQPQQPVNVARPEDAVAGHSVPNHPELTTPSQAKDYDDGAILPINPYADQQVLPGQVIGYGVPTDQNVFAQPPPNAIPTKKSKKPLIIAIVTVVLIAAVAGAVYFLVLK